MVTIIKNKRRVSKNRLVTMLLLGLLIIMVPFILIFFNPVLTLINYRLRLANGTLLHEIMMREIKGPKLSCYLFNISNADRFLSGDDAVLKVEEVGPFVYQEYRTFEDLEFHTESNTLQLTPKNRVELIAEESIGKPEDFYLVLPNIALLAVVHVVSKFPYIIGQIFKVLISGMSLKAFARISAYKHMWNNTEPLIATINSVVPGLIYYNDTGLLSRFYDTDAIYRMTIGTSDLNKFQVKTVKRSSITSTMNSKTLLDKTQFFSNSYEGGVFPLNMTPEMPVHIYRYSMCNTLRMHCNTTQPMEYGSDAFVYTFHDDTFNEHKLCDTKGWCPGGLKDYSMCFNGFPLAVSKGHFLDADSKLFDMIEGLKPNRSLHDSKLVVDPIIGVAVDAYASAQLNLALGDMSLLQETRRLSDTFIPVSQFVLRAPSMRGEAKSILRLLYTTGPYIILSAQVLCGLLGVMILTYCAKMHWHRADSHIILTKTNPVATAPLLN